MTTGEDVVQGIVIHVLALGVRFQHVLLCSVLLSITLTDKAK